LTRKTADFIQGPSLAFEAQYLYREPADLD